MNKRYYVYTLAYPDGRVFYVGKGSKDRMLAHEREAEKKRGGPRSQVYICNCDKCFAIRSVWKQRRDVVRTVVFETDDEQRAYEYERALIARHTSDVLCNRTSGSADLSKITLELRNQFDEAEQEKQERGRRPVRSGSVYQASNGNWCASLSRNVSGYGRYRKKFEAKTRDGAVAKMLHFLEQHQHDGWGPA